MVHKLYEGVEALSCSSHIIIVGVKFKIKVMNNNKDKFQDYSLPNTPWYVYLIKYHREALILVMEYDYL